MMERQTNEIDLIKLLRQIFELLRKHRLAFILTFVLSFSFAVYQKLNEKPIYIYDLVIQSEILEPEISYRLMYPISESIRKKETELAKKLLNSNHHDFDKIIKIDVETVLTSKTYKKTPILKPDSVYYSRLVVKSTDAIDTDTIQKVLIDVWLQSDLLKTERAAFASVYQYQKQLLKEKNEADSLIQTVSKVEDKAWYYRRSLLATEFLIEVDRQIKVFGEGLLIVKPFSPNVKAEPTKNWALYSLMATFTAFVFFGLYVFFYELIAKIRQA